MMRVLMWKEYREHRSIWLAMAVTAVVLLVGVSQLMTSTGGRDEWSRMGLAGAVVVLGWTYGMVCGGMMLAGERENGTLSFLDTLPLRRGQLWWGKCLVGLLLVLSQSVVLAGLIIGLQLYSGWTDLAALLCLLGWFGLVGLAWGLLYSADGHNVLLVVGLAIVTQLLVAFVLLVLVQIVMVVAAFVFHAGPLFAAFGGLLAVLVMGLAPLRLSAHLFSRPDRLRLPDRFAPALTSTRGGYPLRATVWLTWQQMKSLTLGLLVFSILAGFVMLAPNPLVWPSTTLFFGVLCGVTLCGDEQMSGSRRFLGDQRFPLNRLWLTKLVMRLGLCLLAALIMFLPSAIHAAGEGASRAHTFSTPRHGIYLFFALTFHLHLLGTLVPTVQYLLLGLLYGFCLGHLCSLIFQRSIVSAVVALGWSSLLLSVWVPSLLCGGLHFWQPAGVPVLALVASRLLMAPWAADRIVSRRPLLTISGCVGLMLLWTVGGLSFRVLEVPEAAEPFDVGGYAASLPSFDQNKAMQHYRSACAGVVSREHSLEGKLSDIEGQTQHVLQRGWTEKWPAGMQPLGPWLDSMFAGEWTKDLADGADDPVGVMEDPRLATVTGRLSFQTQGTREIPILLVCQGLHRQAGGDPAAFVEYLRQGLALARTLENKALPIVALQGYSVEAVLWTGVRRWMENLKEHPELLRQVLRLLEEHEAAGKTILTDQIHSDYLVVRNTLEQAPEQLPTILLTRISDEEGRAYTWSLLMPWEQARQKRILNSLFQPGDPLPAAREDPDVQPFGSALYYCAPFWERILQSAQLRLCRLRAIRQLVALRLYQTEAGKPAKSLDALVPKYFETLPIDPLATGTQPFGYRISRGEMVEMNLGKTTIEGMFEEAQAGQRAVPEAGGPGMPGMAGMPGAEAGVPGMAGMPGGGVPRRPPPPGAPGIPARVAPAPHERFVPAGQGILWSAGRGVTGVQQKDFTWLVPLPPK